MVKIKKWSLLILGFIIIAFGVSMMVHVAEVGVEPWAAVNVALSDKMFTYGVWNVSIQLFFVFLTILLEKRPPRIGTFLNSIIVSMFIDLILYLNFFPTIEESAFKYLFFVIGIFVGSFGASLVIVTELGAGAKTQFYVVVSKVFNIKLSHSKYAMEAIGLTLAFIVGGPIFVGTILFVFFSGYFIGKMVPILEKIVSPHF